MMGNQVLPDEHTKQQPPHWGIKPKKVTKAAVPKMAVLSEGESIPVSPTLFLWK